MEELYKKHKKIFGYVNTVVFEYLKRQGNLNKFQRIGMDYDDVKQEIYIEVLKALQNYEKKYKDIEKVYLIPHIKKVIYYKLYRLLIKYRNQIFVQLDENAKDSEEPNLASSMKILTNYIDEQDKELDEDKKDINKKIQELNKKVNEKTNQNNFFQPLIVHPDLIPKNPHIKQLSEKEIQNIFKSCSITKEEYTLLCLRIIDNYTLNEIKETMLLSSKQLVHKKLKKAINKIKKEYKTVLQLFTR